jgi:hypothetical protein
MRGIFGADAEHCRDTTRPKLAEPNQADAGDAKATHQLGSKGLRQQCAEACRINAVIRQNAPFDDALDRGKAHEVTL